MRLDYTHSITRILLATVHVRNPFESSPTPTSPARTGARDHDNRAQGPQKDERPAPSPKEVSPPTRTRSNILDGINEGAARTAAEIMNHFRSREATRDGDEAALFDSTAWSSSRMAAINRLGVKTGSDASTISGKASSSQGGEATGFSFTGTVGKGVSRDPKSDEFSPVTGAEPDYQGTNYRLTTGNGDDVINAQLTARLASNARSMVRVANGQIYTGGGNDAVTVNAQGHDTSVLVAAGSGDDTVLITSDGRAGAVGGGSGNDRIVYASTSGGASELQSVQLDGGSGEDTIALSGFATAHLTGGSGADSIDLHNMQGTAYFDEVSDDRISVNSDTALNFDRINGTSQVNMTGDNQTGRIRFLSLQRDQVDITEGNGAVTVTNIATGASLSFNGVAANFTAKLEFRDPPAPPAPSPSIPSEHGTTEMATVTNGSVQVSVQAGKAGATAASGGSLAGSGSIHSMAQAKASSSGHASAAASTKVVNAKGEALKLQSALQATAINTVA